MASELLTAAPSGGGRGRRRGRPCGGRRAARPAPRAVGRAGARVTTTRSMCTWTCGRPRALGAPRGCGRRRAEPAARPHGDRAGPGGRAPRVASRAAATTGRSPRATRRRARTSAGSDVLAQQRRRASTGGRAAGRPRSPGATLGDRAAAAAAPRPRAASEAEPPTARPAPPPRAAAPRWGRRILGRRRPTAGAGAATGSRGASVAADGGPAGAGGPRRSGRQRTRRRREPATRAPRRVRPRRGRSRRGRRARPRRARSGRATAGATGEALSCSATANVSTSPQPPPSNGCAGRSRTARSVPAARSAMRAARSAMRAKKPVTPPLPHDQLEVRAAGAAARARARRPPHQPNAAASSATSRERGRRRARHALPQQRADVERRGDLPRRTPGTSPRTTSRRRAGERLGRGVDDRRARRRRGVRVGRRARRVGHAAPSSVRPGPGTRAASRSRVVGARTRQLAATPGATTRVASPRPRSAPSGSVTSSVAPHAAHVSDAVDDRSPNVSACSRAASAATRADRQVERGVEVLGEPGALDERRAARHAGERGGRLPRRQQLRRVGEPPHRRPVRRRSRLDEGRLRRLGDVVVALPALVLELERLDRDGVGVGVELRQRLVLRDPAAEDLVGDRELAGLVVDLDDDVLAEVLQRRLRAEPGAEVPDLVGPLLELDVVGDAALERDRLVLRAAGRLAAASSGRRRCGA